MSAPAGSIPGSDIDSSDDLDEVIDPGLRIIHLPSLCHVVLGAAHEISLLAGLRAAAPSPAAFYGSAGAWLQGATARDLS